jgi:hypothetical protein
MFNKLLISESVNKPIKILFSYVCKFTLISALLFLWAFKVYGQEEVNIEGDFDGELFFKSPSLVLGQLTPESGHVAWAKGVRGAIVNPAALSEIRYGEIATAYVQRKNWSNYQRFNFDGGDDIGDVSLPVMMNAEHKGGFGYILSGFKPPKPGGIAFGGGDLASDLFELRLLGSGNADMEFSYLVPYTITSNDLPGLPAGVQIPVEFQVDGRVVADVNGDVNANLVHNPAYFAMALDGGSVALGVGVKSTHVEGDLSANFSLRGSGSLQASTSTISAGWTTDLTGIANFSEQDLTQVGGSIDVSGNAISLIVGTILKANHLRFGFTMEGTPSIPLGNNYDLLVLRPIDPPNIIGLIDNGIMIDTLARTIQGDMVIDLSPLPLRSEGQGGEDFYTLSKQFNFKMGMAMDVSPLLLIVFDVGRSYASTLTPITSFAFSLQLAQDMPVSFHSGINVSTRAYQIADKTWYVPSGSATVGTSLKIKKNLEFNLAASSNTLTYAGSSFEEIARQITMRQVMDSYVVGFGVKVGF